MKKKHKKIFILLSIFFLPCLFSMQLYAQNINVSGIVMDSQGELLAGVTIKVKNSDSGTISNSKGSFLLTNISPNGEIELSFVGFESKTISVNGQKTLKITLEELEQTLEELVVVGYGTQRKEDLTGSIAQVNVSDMVKAPVGSFDQAMAGRVAGVSVSTRDGQPGEESSFVIRGGNSLTQSTAPLFVVDGFLMENFSSAAISPQDIQSISILKDASATAIYGARGANGVVVIETKKGIISKKPSINYGSSVGFQQITKLMDLMNPYEFVEYQQEFNSALTDQYYLKNQGKTLEDYRDAVAYNWQERMFRTAPMHKHDLSIRGGGQETRYSVSGSLFNQEGIIIKSGYERFSGRVTLDQNIGKRLKFGLVVGAAQTKTRGSAIAQGDQNIRTSSGYVLAQVWSFSPANIGNQPVDWENEFVDPSASVLHFRVNPVQNTRETYNRSVHHDLNVNARLSYEIIKGLILRTSIGKNERRTESGYFFNSRTLYGTPLNPDNTRGAWGGMRHNSLESWLNENTLTYNTRIKKHLLTALLGFTVQDRESVNTRFSAEHVPNESLGIIGLGSGKPLRNETSKSFSRTSSFLSRVNYTYNQRYMLTSTFRADGSSKFSPKNRWGYFPSVGLAWRVSEESFLKRKKWISNLKLRASYGITGNNRIVDFLYYPKININESYGYSFGNAMANPGAVVTNIANYDLKWESTEQIDFGLDIGLFNNRLSLEIDAYRKNTKDLLLNAPLPFYTGFKTMMQNIGEIRNEGIELSLKSIPIKTKSFVWESSFNIAFNKNIITSFVTDESNLMTTVNWSYGYKKPLYLARTGGPAAIFYGFIHDGNYQYDDFDELSPGKYTLKGDRPNNGNNRATIRPGDIKYKDMNDDGVIDDADMCMMGNPIPIHFGGFSNTFKYHNLSLSVLLQWSYGNDVFNANRAIFEGNALKRPNQNQFKSVVNRWRPDNPTNDIPRARGQGPIGAYDSRTVEDASFLRVKTIALEYRFPKKVLSKLNLKNLSLNIVAQNLFTFTSYKGMDPEVSTRNSALTPGFDYSSYPRAKTIVFGIKLDY